MTPLRVLADDPCLPRVHALIPACFDEHKGRIDPVSSANRLTLSALRDSLQTGELWVLSPPLSAAVILTPRPDHLYLGKLAVDPAHRALGHARCLLAHAKARGRALGLATLRIETRVELTEVHRLFRRAGFTQTREGRHAGYTRTTFLEMEFTAPAGSAPGDQR